MKLKTEGVPKGALESYTFPSSTILEKDVSWSATVRNVGDLGSIALGIVNVSGNPSTIVIIYNGKEYTLELGYYLKISQADIPNNGTLSINGTVRFSVAGTYSMKLWAMHLEDGVWSYDQEIVKSVIAALPPKEASFFDTIIEAIKVHPFETIVIVIGAGLGWTALRRQKKE